MPFRLPGFSGTGSGKSGAGGGGRSGGKNGDDLFAGIVAQRVQLGVSVR
jgi:hypothetical protein